MAKVGVVFRPIIPKKPDAGSIPGKFRRTANEIAKDIEKDLLAPTKSWKHRVKFTRTLRFDYPRTILVSVTTTDEAYGYLDKGTKAHSVAPKTKKALAWTSKAGERRFSKGHRVKGVQARYWTKAAKKRAEPRIKKLSTALMKDIAKDL